MQSPPAEPPSDNSTGKSRLDRELEEILSRNDNIRHLPPPPSQKKPRPIRPTAPAGTSYLPPAAKKLLETPIVVALAVSLLAYALRDVSALLASVLCFVAVACIILPIVRRFQRPTAAPPTQMWRGRTFEVGSPQNESIVDSIRSWWSSRQR